MENNPYAPPTSSIEGPLRAARAEVEGQYEFRDLGRIGALVSALLLIGVVVRILGIASSLLQLKLFSHAPYSMAEATANDARELLIGYAHILVYVTTVFFFSRWIYLAHRNLPALGAENLRFRPGWALGSFFVPIANLWLPFQATSDLVKASRNPRQWELEDTPFLIVVWWILWIVVAFLDNGIMHAGLHARTVPDLYALTVIQVVSGVLSVPLSLLARYIVQSVTRDQFGAARSDSDRGHGTF